MPVTPLPEDNTRRMFLNWEVGALSHSTMIRVADGPTAEAIRDDLHGMFVFLIDFMASNCHIVGLDEAVSGSNVRNPVPGWTVIDGLGTNDTVTGQRLARSFSYRGRSATGRKTKGLLWGLVLPEQADFQYTPTVGSDLVTFMNALNSFTFEFLAIDGSKPVYKSDLLEDYNDHWEVELRP